MEQKEISTEIATLPPVERAALALGTSKAETQLRELITKSAAITTVIDPAGREEAHRAGMTLKNARVAIEKTGKAAREDAQAFSAAVIAEEKRLKAITEAEEKRVFGLRDAFDAKVAAEKAEKERIERERVAAIRVMIEQIRQIPADLLAASAAEVEHEVEVLRGFKPGAEFAEFAYEAMQAVSEVVRALEVMHVRKSAQEAEAARLVAERAELERLRKEQAERELLEAKMRAEHERITREVREAEDARLRAEREAFEAERRAFQAEQARIAEDRAAAEKLARDHEEALTINAAGHYYSTTTFRDDGKPIMCNPDGSRSIFCDVDEDDDVAPHQRETVAAMLESGAKVLVDPAGIAEPVALFHGVDIDRAHGLAAADDGVENPFNHPCYDEPAGMATTEPDDAAAVQHFRDIVAELLNTRTSDEIRVLLEEELVWVPARASQMDRQDR